MQTIRRWWQELGQLRYPQATRLTITADGGGSTGSRVRLGKRELQGLATEFGIDIAGHHLPLGTSKWNRIEHRLFSFVSMNWNARPFVSDRLIVDVISATTTKMGLTVRCALDSSVYQKGIVIFDKDMKKLAVTHHTFHGEWDYTIHPAAYRLSARSIKAVNPERALQVAWTFALLTTAKTWRWLKGENQLPKVVQGVTLTNRAKVIKTPARKAT